MTGPVRFTKILGLKFAEDLKGNLRSKSQKLFAELGLMKVNSGMVTLSPYLMKSLRKLERLVHKKMQEVQALEVQLPSLSEMDLLHKSKRKGLSDIFRLRSGSQNFYLNPTCEEAAANLLASSFELTHRQLPCRLYQITNKFRDEKRSKSGLLRAKEFTMKDLYCFDANEESAKLTYNEIKKKYHEFFQDLGVPYICVKGNEGDIGGIESHEFHYLSEAGDDYILSCYGCGHEDKVEQPKTNINLLTCPNCNSNNIKISQAIEVGHIFNLGTRYTEPFAAMYLSYEGEHELLHMSCYGLGLTRILAASVEVLSLDQEIRWPVPIAPYLLCILQAKDNSMEAETCARVTEAIVRNLSDCLDGEIIIDDRVSMTYFKRMKIIRSLGIPYAVVLGKEACGERPELEVHDVNQNVVHRVRIEETIPFLRALVLEKPLQKKSAEKQNSLKFTI